MHAGYEFEPPSLPVPALEEAIAEKLAAWRRRRKARDLYDLYWFGQGPLDQALVRRLVALKIYFDVVADHLGTRPFDPAELLDQADHRDMVAEDIGLLTQPVEPERWLTAFTNRFEFLHHLDPTETDLARCDPRDHWMATQLARELW